VPQQLAEPPSAPAPVEGGSGESVLGALSSWGPPECPGDHVDPAEGKKGKVFPYSLPSVGPGADPGVQAVSPQVT